MVWRRRSPRRDGCPPRFCALCFCAVLFVGFSGESHCSFSAPIRSQALERKTTEAWQDVAGQHVCRQLFAIVARRRQWFLRFKQTEFLKLATACQDAIGQTVDVEYLGYPSGTLQSSSLGIQLTRADRGKQVIKPFTADDAQALAKSLGKLDFVDDGGVVVEKDVLRFAVQDDILQKSIEVNIVLGPQLVEEFPNLRGGADFRGNFDRISEFFRQSEEARLAVAGIRACLVGGPEGMLIEAIAWRVGQVRRFPSADREDLAARTFLYFLHLLQAFRDWETSDIFAADLKLDLDNLGLQHPEQRGRCISGFEDFRRQIHTLDWLNRLSSVWENDDEYCHNALRKIGKHPDRHCFLAAKPAGKFKCISCYDYNNGVGLGPDDRCQACGQVQTKHPEFEGLRQHVEEYSSTQNTTFDPPPEEGRWLLRLGNESSIKSHLIVENLEAEVRRLFPEMSTQSVQGERFAKLLQRYQKMSREVVSWHCTEDEQTGLFRCSLIKNVNRIATGQLQVSKQAAKLSALLAALRAAEEGSSAQAEQGEHEFWASE